MTKQLRMADLSQATDEQHFGLGEVHVDPDGRHWEYVQADGAITAGHACIVSSAGQADALNTTNDGSVGGKIGIADHAFADNQYGFLFRGFGLIEAVVANSVAAGTAMTTTANDGIIGTGGVAIQGLSNVDAGVTATRVTCYAASLMSVNV